MASGSQMVPARNIFNGLRATFTHVSEAVYIGAKACIANRNTKVYIRPGDKVSVSSDSDTGANDCFMSVRVNGFTTRVYKTDLVPILPSDGWCAEPPADFGKYLGRLDKEFKGLTPLPGKNGVAWNTQIYWGIGVHSEKPKIDRQTAKMCSLVPKYLRQLERETKEKDAEAILKMEEEKLSSFASMSNEMYGGSSNYDHNPDRAIDRVGKRLSVGDFVKIVEPVESLARYTQFIGVVEGFANEMGMHGSVLIYLPTEDVKAYISANAVVRCSRDHFKLFERELRTTSHEFAHNSRLYPGGNVSLDRMRAEKESYYQAQRGVHGMAAYPGPPGEFKWDLGNNPVKIKDPSRYPTLCGDPLSGRTEGTNVCKNESLKKKPDKNKLISRKVKPLRTNTKHMAPKSSLVVEMDVKLKSRIVK